MNAYERNLQRLTKAEKLIDLAVHSGTLQDRNWKQPLDISAQYVWAALGCLQLAIKNQAVYLVERAKKKP